MRGEGQKNTHKREHTSARTRRWEGGGNVGESGGGKNEEGRLYISPL